MNVFLRHRFLSGVIPAFWCKDVPCELNRAALVPFLKPHSCTKAPLIITKVEQKVLAEHLSLNLFQKLMKRNQTVW